MILQVFSVPKTSRRLKPFVDHILLFSVLDGKIWFRNYQVWAALRFHESMLISAFR